MARQVYISNFDQINKSFREIVNAVEDVVKNDDNIKKETSLKVGEELAKTIEQKYTNYIQRISNFEHGTKNVRVVVSDTKKGCVVKIRGKDVLYHEYGTGSRGLAHKHPRHDADGMKPYGSGQNVIRGTEQVKVTYYTDKKYGKIKWMYINKNNGRRTPYWYPLFLDGKDFPNDLGGQPTGREYVWRHNGVITKGLPAGRFIYESVKEFKDEGKIVTHTKNILQTTIKETIVPRIKQKTKRISQQINNNKPEVKIVQSSDAAREKFTATLSAMLDSFKG